MITTVEEGIKIYEDELKRFYKYIELCKNKYKKGDNLFKYPGEIREGLVIFDEKLFAMEKVLKLTVEEAEKIRAKHHLSFNRLKMYILE